VAISGRDWIGGLTVLAKGQNRRRQKINNFNGPACGDELAPKFQNPAPSSADI